MLQDTDTDTVAGSLVVRPQPYATALGTSTPGRVGELEVVVTLSSRVVQRRSRRRMHIAGGGRDPRANSRPVSSRVVVSRRHHLPI